MTCGLVQKYTAAQVFTWQTNHLTEFRKTTCAFIYLPVVFWTEL